MIDTDHAALGFVRQGELLGVSRSAWYRQLN
jgi:hypothetical protein